MTKPSQNGDAQRHLAILTGVVVTFLVLVCLYWAQTIFIPLTLAIYLTFLLSPLVSFLQRRRFGRIPAVLAAVGAIGIFLGGVGWMVTHELTSLVNVLPQYQGNIQQKIQALRQSAESPPLRAIQHLMRELRGDTEPAPPGSATHGWMTGTIGSAASPPKTVTIEPETPAWVARLPSLITSLVELLGTLALTLVLVIFMLLNREDLRNRLIRLIGHGQLALTTKALDDAAQRISRYLFVQAIGNGAFGLVLAIGLFLIGVPYAMLWGFLAALLRYLPYVGTWIAALFPLALSIATTDGWLTPLLVLALYGSIEIFHSNAIEPRLFGQSMGISEVALLVAATFWAFLWGPVGLLLSNPLTVCLVVLGKYFPQLEYFTVLLGDEPALAPELSYYQRLLAHDHDEALKLVQTSVRGTAPEEVYDRLLIPALTFTKRDHERDELTDDDEQYILQTTREIIAQLAAENADALRADPEAEARSNGQTPPARVLVLGCPARDEADELALEMLGQLLDPAKWDLDVASTELLSAELVARAETDRPALICISSLPAGGLGQARYLCQRLRAKLPEAKILIGRWGLKRGMEDNQAQLHNAGADEIHATLLETRDSLRAWFPVLSQTIKDSPAPQSAAAPI